MKQVQYLILITILLCINVLAQEDINSGGVNTYETLKNGQVIYQNGPNGVDAGPYLALEGFETSFPPTGWGTYFLNDDWQQNDYEMNSGLYSAAIFCDPENEAWLITPAIDLTTASGSFINYYERVDQFDYVEGEHNVLISTNYVGSGNPNAANWNVLRNTIEDYFSWELREIDLSTYEGDTVYIAFQYIGSGELYECGTDWYIDDVIVDDLCTGIEPIPNCATINSPPDGATLNPTFVTFSWSPPGADATKQLFYVGTDGNGTITPTNVYDSLEYSENTNGVGPVQLAANTTYYWQIIPANCSQTAVNCPIWSFTTNDGEINYGGGGTTQGGYYWANSTAGASGAPSQPTFNWIDISGTGIDLIGSITDNQTVGPLPLGFTFNYFGNNYTEFYIGANGFVSFSAAPGFTAFPYPIPSPSSADNVVAGYWKDLDPTNLNVSGKHLYYAQSGGDMVITYENYPQASADANGWITFQIIIQQSGNVKIQYSNSGTSFNVDDGTVGIENSDGTKGILYRHRQYGGAIFSSPLALEFGTNSGALPVELSSFSASIIEQGVKLNWVTETEVGNYGFEVQRSVSENQSSAWKNIGFVEGFGNSNSPKEYSFIDENVAGGNYSYRLKQIDTDGKFEYSKVIEIDFSTPLNYELSQNYPNPFNPSTKISFQIVETGFTSLKVYDAIGNEVKTLVNENKPAGTYTVDFSARGGSAFGGDAYTLPSGIYFYKLEAGSFVETKKMMLLK